MKKIFFSLTVISSILFASCIKNDPVLYQDTFAEIDAASWNANSAGVTYPNIPYRLPQNRAASAASDSTLRRLSGSTRVRINLVGPQSGQQQTVGFKIFSTPVSSFSFPATLFFSNPAAIGRQVPAVDGQVLSVTDAIPGTHYNLLNVMPGKIIIPADSSFGILDIQILDPGANAGQARFIGIQLDSTGTILPMPNYNRIGLVIDQR